MLSPFSLTLFMKLVIVIAHFLALKYYQKLSLHSHKKDMWAFSGMQDNSVLRGTTFSIKACPSLCICKNICAESLISSLAAADC